MEGKFTEIVAEVLSLLSIATKEVKYGLPSELFLLRYISHLATPIFGQIFFSERDY